MTLQLPGLFCGTCDFYGNDWPGIDAGLCLNPECEKQIVWRYAERCVLFSSPRCASTLADVKEHSRFGRDAGPAAGREADGQRSVQNRGRRGNLEGVVSLRFPRLPHF